MQEDVISLPPGFRLYSDRAIAIGTFIGGPLVAGYLAAQNFNRFGQKAQARNAWIFAIIATILIFGGIFTVPAIENLPRYIIPVAYTALTQILIQKYQGGPIKKHKAEGGQMYSTWRAVWIGLIGLAALVAAIYVILYFAIPADSV